MITQKEIWIIWRTIIEEIVPEFLADALYILSNTYNKRYVPVFIRFESHHNQNVSNTAKNALIELSKKP